MASFRLIVYCLAERNIYVNLHNVWWCCLWNWFKFGRLHDIWNKHKLPIKSCFLNQWFSYVEFVVLLVSIANTVPIILSLVTNSLKTAVQYPYESKLCWHIQHFIYITSELISISVSFSLIYKSSWVLKVGFNNFLKHNAILLIQLPQHF